MLTIRQFAEVVGISSLTAYRWAEGGKIQVRRSPGGRIRIDEAEVEMVLSGKRGTILKGRPRKGKG